MAQPQTYSKQNSVVCCPVLLSQRHSQRQGHVSGSVQGPSLTRNNPSHPPSPPRIPRPRPRPSPQSPMTTPNPPPDPLARCWDGMCRRTLGRECDAGRVGKYCAQLTIAKVFYACVGAVSFGTVWIPLRAFWPVLAVAAFVWGEQVFFLLLML